MLISQYINAVYHGNNIKTIDTISKQTDMWSTYDFDKTSQVNYFSIEVG